MYFFSDFSFKEIHAVNKLISNKILKKIYSELIKCDYNDFLLENLKSKFPNVKNIIVSAPSATSAAAFLKKANKLDMKIVNFEHGLTSGFAMRNKYYINFSEALYCNIMFVANNAAKKEYENVK